MCVGSSRRVMWPTVTEGSTRTVPRWAGGARISSTSRSAPVVGGGGGSWACLSQPKRRWLQGSGAMMTMMPRAGGQSAQRGAHRARSCAARPCSRSGWRGSESSAPTPVHVSGASCTRQQLCPPPGLRGFRPPAHPTPCGLRTCQLERAVHIGRLPSGGDSAQQRTCCWTAATRSSWRSGVAVSSA
jgi:hypothetical protein